MALTLTACTTDSLMDDLDSQNTDTGSQYQTNSFNNNNSGQYAGYGPGGLGFWGDNYISPWDVWFRTSNVNGQIDLQPSYFFINGSVEDVTPYNIEVFAYAGLAYFDGDNNGTYEDPKLAATTGNGFVAQMNNGNYPTLDANNQEVGNLVKTVATIDMFAYPHTNSSFRIEDRVLHLPTKNTQSPLPQPIYPTPAYPYAGFDFGQPGTLLTQDELDLLGKYGKIFFYEVVVTDKATGAFVLSSFMYPKIETLPTGTSPDPGWQPVTDGAGNNLQGNVPTLGNFDLYYFYANIGGTKWDITQLYNTNLCDSREVVFDASTVPSEIQIDPNFKITLDFYATGYTGWVNSALYLNVHSN